MYFFRNAIAYRRWQPDATTVKPLVMELCDRMQYRRSAHHWQLINLLNYGSTIAHELSQLSLYFHPYR